MEEQSNGVGAIAEALAQLSAGREVGTPSAAQSHTLPYAAPKPKVKAVARKQDFYAHGLWGMCGPNDVIPAYVDGQPFADWLNWKAQQYDRDFGRLLASKAPSMADGTHTSGVMTNECGECESVKWGKCEFNWTKALICRSGEEVNPLNLGYGYCEEQPVFRIDGTRITNNAEWQAALAADELSRDLELQLVYGNRASTNELDGIQRLVRTGYTDCRTGRVCPPADSIVVDWQHDGFNGTCNNHGNIIRKIEDIYRRFKLRAQRKTLNTNDMIIMLPSFMRDALVDYWAQFGTFLVTGTIQIDATEVFRRREEFISGGLFDDGWVPVSGKPISFLVNDFLPMDQCTEDCAAGGYSSDIYVLTRKFGNMEVLYGTYQDLSQDVQRELAGRFGSDRFAVTDAGKFLMFNMLTTGICFNTSLLMRPGLTIKAPFLQARIYDVCATAQFEPISKVPDSYYALYQVHSEPYTGDLECYSG